MRKINTYQAQTDMQSEGPATPNDPRLSTEQLMNAATSLKYKGYSYAAVAGLLHQAGAKTSTGRRITKSNIAAVIYNYKQLGSPASLERLPVWLVEKLGWKQSTETEASIQTQEPITTAVHTSPHTAGQLMRLIDDIAVCNMPDLSKRQLIKQLADRL